jgi:hypothetical protein
MNVKILIDQVARYWQYWVKRWKIKIACASRTGCYLVYSYNPIFTRILKSGKRTFNWESRIKKTDFQISLVVLVEIGKTEFWCLTGSARTRIPESDSTSSGLLR